MPQRPSHNKIRVRSVGSPFEITTNFIGGTQQAIPPTLNYIDCFPTQEKQFGEQQPIYQVTCREPFYALTTYNFQAITPGTVTNNASEMSLGTPPTTLSGYGITDATPSSHVGSTGTAHGNATTSVAGFMSASDKTKLDGIATGATNYVLPSASSSTLGGVKVYSSGGNLYIYTS